MEITKENKEKIYELALENKNEEAMNIFFNDYQPTLVKVNEYLESIHKDSQNIADITYKSSNIIRIISFWILVAISIVTIRITVTIEKYITESLSNPILEIEMAANNMAKGIFDVDLNYYSKDELGILSDSMRTMVKITNKVILDTSRRLKEIANGNVDIEPETEYIGIFDTSTELVSEIAAASEELTAQAINLNKMVSQFKLKMVSSEM